MPQKHSKALTLKAHGDDGRFAAVIATLNVIDKDGDLTVPGAFGKQHVHVLPAHDSYAPSMGKAVLEEKDEKAIADGRFNLNMAAGKEWFESIKFDVENGESLQEWSYGFFIKDAATETVDGEKIRILKSLDVFEISPVLIGAGEGTGTLAVKCKRHKTEVDVAPFDTLLHRKRVKAGQSEDYYKHIFAAKVGAKWKFGHHFIDQDGNPGAASVRACLKGIAELNGMSGEPGLDPDARAHAYEHLAGHLKDAGIDNPPPLKDAAETGAIKLVDQITFATWELEAALKRAEELADMRADEGRRLSAETGNALNEAKAALSNVIALDGRLGTVLSKSKGPTPGEKALGRFLHTEARIKGRV